MQAGETQIAKYKVSPLIRLSAVKNDQQIICSHTKCCSIANSGGNETPGDPGLTIESLRTLASSTKLKVGHSFTECPKYTKALHNGVSVGMKDKRAFRFSTQLRTTKKVGHCGVPNPVSSLQAKVKPIDPMRAVASSNPGVAHQKACFNSDTIGPILGACLWG